eukprot:1203898-Amphidinium_carterae.1
MFKPFRSQFSSRDSSHPPEMAALFFKGDFDIYRDEHMVTQVCNRGWCDQKAKLVAQTRGHTRSKSCWTL